MNSKLWPEVRVAREILVLLRRRRRVAVGPARDLRLEVRELGPHAEIGDEAGGHDHEVDLEAARLGLDEHDVVARGKRFPTGARVELKTGLRLRARQGVGRGKLTHAQDLQNEAPLFRVRQIGVVLQKTHEFGPTVGIAR